MGRRRNRARVVRARSTAFWASLLASGVCLGSVVGGCATAVDTLEPLDEVAGDGGSTNPTDGGKTSTAGKTSSGGSKNSGGSSSGSSSGGTLTGAFGGTASTGGKTGAGGTANAGTSGSSASGGGGGANGGTASGGGGAGGKSAGGSGGSASGGSANGGSANGGSGGSGTPLACLMSWKGDQCDTCSTQTQSDKLACADILNCYAANNCGPSTCGGNTDKCGANNIGKGTAGYPIAQTVYDCLCK